MPSRQGETCPTQCEIARTSPVGWAQRQITARWEQWCRQRIYEAISHCRHNKVQRQWGIAIRGAYSHLSPEAILNASSTWQTRLWKLAVYPGWSILSPGQYGGKAIQLSEKQNPARQGLTDILRAGFQLLKCNFVNMRVQGYEQRPFQDGVLAFRIMGQILSYDQADSAVTFSFCDIDVGKATCEIERILPGPWLAVSGGAEGGKFLVIGLLLVSLLVCRSAVPRRARGP
ncbi:hypothetical protein B0H17DRAFT_1139290 [Mycena rosella]|uniref:Uncharacterized protein n=1 Tax=Mycena rosella TaxID=1033263 RepID=A0AAD7D4E3_MYCRO|nr:hypothetical protein B0H17DRAFT_1139290 [Mycena rosella]